MDRSQSEWLQIDLAETRRVVQENLKAFAPLGDLADLTRQNYLAVVADLCWRVLYHVRGVEILLREELRDPLLVVQRAIFETLITLSYLAKHPEAEQETLVYRAFTQFKELKWFADQPGVVEDRKRLLARMPADAVTTAEARAKSRPYTWSGKTLKQMSEASDVVGYATTYDYLSAQAHSAIVGERVRTLDNGDGTISIEFGQLISQEECDLHANLARRALKHSFRILWRIYIGCAGSPHSDARSRRVAEPFLTDGPSVITNG